MKKLLSILACAAVFCLAAQSEEITVSSFRYAGPYPVMKPFMVDTVDVNSKPFDIKKLLDLQVSPEGFDVLPESWTQHEELL